MGRVNPSSDNDALPDFKGDKRTTPARALVEIERLRAAGDLDGEQIQLLEDWEAYIIGKWQVSKPEWQHMIQQRV